MTSASELFYSRRYRWGRTDADLGLDSDPPDRHQRRHHGHNSNHRRDLNACGAFRRSLPQERHQSPRFFNHLALDRSAAQTDSSITLGSRNNINVNIRNSSRNMLSEDSRLPGAVLLARERLLERLRGGASSPSSRNDASPVEALDENPEISTSQSWRSSLVDADRPRLVPELSKRPPGLSPEAIDRLQLEVFMHTEHTIDNNDPTTAVASTDCSICLESFSSGDQLIHLPCEHRFHHSCLDQWIRTCGDCPYCRQHIVVD